MRRTAAALAALTVGVGIYAGLASPGTDPSCKPRPHSTRSTIRYFVHHAVLRKDAVCAYRYVGQPLKGRDTKADYRRGDIGVVPVPHGRMRALAHRNRRTYWVLVTGRGGGLFRLEYRRHKITYWLSLWNPKVPVG